MMKHYYILTALLMGFSLSALADDAYWQQRAEYEMDINMNVETNQYSGSQKLVYYNNSPDQLEKVFYHLYFNAFQPGSMMDVRSLTIEDPDPRVSDRISQLQPDEEGWMRVKSLKMNGQELSYDIEGTILEVKLDEPIKPGKKAIFEMVWDAQVPLQIRRSGRDNKEGIKFSMSQWYPKMCEYDEMGWHANPYVGREFHGVWGDFEVNITIDENYIIGATGVLQNPEEIGFGYVSEEQVKKKSVNGKLTWEFLAEDVHDFVWAADPDYLHTTAQVPDGPKIHFFYQNNPEFNENWEQLSEYAVKAFEYMSERFGAYPYPIYSIIQGGDGGMEYPMATLITGERNLRSLVGVTVHEAAHSWYQAALATNEALYEWMDEGFTSYATSLTMHELFPNPDRQPHDYAYQGYLGIVRAGKENPLSTHADHYETNYAYGVAAYSKGQVLLEQLGYIIGAENRDKGLLQYFNEWKFKHPTPNDFKRVMEKVSGIELDWYFEYFVHTIHTIDYSIAEVRERDGMTYLTLERKGKMPMPLDVMLTLTDGSRVMHNIPLVIMRGEKPPIEAEADKWVIGPDWPWTNPFYQLAIEIPLEDIASIEIDPYNRMADTDRENNRLTIDEGMGYLFRR